MCMFFACVVLWLALLGHLEATPLAISTPCGLIQGHQSNGVDQYEGIPFGQASRFAHSTVSPCWNGTLSATKLGPACWNLGTSRLVQEENERRQKQYST